MKDIKHISMDFHSLAWVKPQGWDIWVSGGMGGVRQVKNLFFQNSTKFGVWVTHMNGLCNSAFFYPWPLGPLGGAKRSNIIKFQLQSK